MDVRKTNGSLEEYDKAKLARGIHEAYKTAGQYCDDAIVVTIINNLYIYDGIASSEIRRQVEESLMSINKKVALAYIEKFDADIDLRKKRDFIKDYIAASNAATGSKFDSNANVTRKTISSRTATLCATRSSRCTASIWLIITWLISRAISFISTMRAARRGILTASPSRCILSLSTDLRISAAFQ